MNLISNGTMSTAQSNLTRLQAGDSRWLRFGSLRRKLARQPVSAVPPAAAKAQTPPWQVRNANRKPFFGWQHGWQWQGNAIDNKMLTTRGNTMSTAYWRQVNGFALDAVADGRISKNEWVKW